MKKKSMIYFIVIILLISSSFPLNKVFANTTNKGYNYYFKEGEYVLSNSQKDDIFTYAELLSFKKVDLIVNVELQNNYGGNEESKQLFYDYIKGSTENKVIVFSYYVEDKEIQIYDDYGIFTDKDIENVKNTMSKFVSDDKTGEGLVYVYKNFSKVINEKLSLGVLNISETVIENPYTKSPFSAKNITLTCIVIVLGFGFRRNKNKNISVN